MLRSAEELMDHMGSKDLFNQAGVGFLREAWVAGTFCNMRGLSACRLIDDHRPDFELEFRDKIERFELVEVDSTRMRGREYRSNLTGDGSPAKWADRAMQIPTILYASGKGRGDGV